MDCASKKQEAVLKKLCIFLILILTSCGTKEYIVLRDVPENPTFTVIPADNYLSEVAFANRIERYLISAGVKVVQRPGMKHIQTEQSEAERQSKSDSSTEAAGKVLTETYFMREPTAADYIVLTYRHSLQIRIIKNKTQEVLTVLSLPIAHQQFGSDPERKYILDALSHMQIHTIQTK